MPVTDQQTRAIAFLATACRPHGASRWDEAGVVAAVRKVQHLALADVILAAIRAADDRTVQTPGVISTPSSPCWRERSTDRPQPREPFNPATNCGICSQPEHRCRATRNNGHDYTRAIDIKRTAVPSPGLGKGDQ